MERAYARTSDPITSHDAAASVPVARLELLVLCTIYEYGPLTWDEIGEKTGVRLGSISPRLKPLFTKGLIDERGRRPGTSGHSQIVWGLTRAGLYRVQAERRTIAGWGEVTGKTVLDPDGFNRRDPYLHERKFSWGEYAAGALRSTQAPSGSPITTKCGGIKVADIDSITDEQWGQILDGQVQMKGWLRKRMKRAVRLLTEGRIYDDTNSDQRFGPRTKR